MARSYIAGPGEVSIFFRWMKNSLLYRSARTKTNGARAKDCVIVPLGPSESEQYRRLRWQAVPAVRLSGNKIEGTKFRWVTLISAESAADKPPATRIENSLSTS